METPYTPPQPLKCPKVYQEMEADEIRERIMEIKSARGENLVLLGHHYQNDAIVELADFIGDSFKLCQDAAQASAQTIVFCGVRFMAESARVVARDDQVVLHPEPGAGCPMADMARLDQVELAWRTLHEMNQGRTIIPVTYMNSDVEIKAFCGRKGGVVCTSSNAAKVFDWAFSQGDMIFFLPDEHLGKNTAHQMEIPREHVCVWNPRYAEAHGRDKRFSKARVVVWKGHCHVHTHFTVEQLQTLRDAHPKARIIVHPECPREVVALCDDSGSTEKIIRLVREGNPGETFIVGTESHLVRRLANQYPDRKVLPLADSICWNMQKITLGGLLWVLEEGVGEVELEPEVAQQARQALEKMLELA